MRGHTLIDVLVAIAVLAIGLLALAVLQGTLARTGADARARTQIAAFVESVMERQRAAGVASGFVDLPIVPAWTPDELEAASSRAGVGDLVVTLSSTHYDGRSGVFLPVDAHPADPIETRDPQYKELQITARWTDARGAPRQVTLASILSPRSLDDSALLASLPAGEVPRIGPVVHAIR